MGFFDINVKCVLCEKEIGLNRNKTKHGWVCRDCMNKLLINNISVLNIGKHPLDDLKKIISQENAEDKKTITSTNTNKKINMFGSKSTNSKVLKILLWIFLFPIMLCIFIWKNKKINQKYKIPMIIGVIIISMLIAIASNASQNQLKKALINKCYSKESVSKLEKVYGISNLNGNFISDMKCKNLKIKDSNYKELTIEEKDNKLLGIKVKDGMKYKYVYYIDKSHDIYDSKTLELKEKADKKLKAEREKKELEEKKAQEKKEKEAKEAKELEKKLKPFTSIGLSKEESLEALNILKNCGINSVNKLEKHTQTENVKTYKFAYDGYQIIIFFANNKVYAVSSGNLELYKNGNYKKLQDYTLTDSEKANLKTIAEEYVKSQLKSPSSAKFPGSFLSPYENWGMQQAGLVYKVSSYVDAQNSFGAMIRSNFYLEFKFDSSGNLNLTTFVLDGKRLK